MPAGPDSATAPEPSPENVSGAAPARLDALVRAEEECTWVTRAAAGDEQALGRLYDRHGASAFALASAIVRDAADAEEVVAQTFAQLWQTAAQFDPARGGVGGWIMTIARSRALDVVRARQRRTRAIEAAAREDNGGFALPLSSGPLPPDLQAEHDETRRLVADSVAALPDAQRHVIELAYFGGFSQTEIAEQLGEPLGTVKTRTRAAMEKLRRALAPCFGGGRRDTA